MFNAQLLSGFHGYLRKIIITVLLSAVQCSIVEWFSQYCCRILSIECPLILFLSTQERERKEREELEKKLEEERKKAEEAQMKEAMEQQQKELERYQELERLQKEREEAMKRKQMEEEQQKQSQMKLLGKNKSRPKLSFALGMK